jgi:hypothetical protein
VKKAIATIVVLAAAMVIPATSASADTLPGSYARSKALDVALDWALASPEASNWYVDYCKRRSQHVFACDANISWTTYGALHCSDYSYTCRSTDTDHYCWKTVTAKLSPHWAPWKVRYRIGGTICRTYSHTETY